MLAGVSQLEEGSDRKTDFESGACGSKYLSEAAAMQKSSRAAPTIRRRSLNLYKFSRVTHAACQFEI